MKILIHSLVCVVLILGCGIKDILDDADNGPKGIYVKNYNFAEGISELTLFGNNRFQYRSEMGGCVSLVFGDWAVGKSDTINFQLDHRYSEVHSDSLRRGAKYQAFKDFQLHQDSSLYLNELRIAEMRPCYPQITFAIFRSNQQSIFFRDDVDCVCASIQGQHRTTTSS